MQNVLPALQPLRDRFIVMSKLRAAELSALRNRMRQGQQPGAAICEIGEIVHKISGVAATLGFPQWGQLAAELDSTINLARKRQISMNDAWDISEPKLDTLIDLMVG